MKIFSEELVERAVSELHIADLSQATIGDVLLVAQYLEKETGIPFIRMDQGSPGLPANQIGIEAAFHMAFQMKKNFVKRATQADYIRQMLDAGEGPVIICGDFNDTPASYTYRTVKGDLTDGFRDCGSGFGYTFRQLKRIFRIDYIIYSPDFKGVTYDSPNLDYSDHKPVVWLGYVN